ncbi:hypothetical protein GCM10009848_32610 [Micromonospora lupini]
MKTCAHPRRRTQPRHLGPRRIHADAAGWAVGADPPPENAPATSRSPGPDRCPTAPRDSTPSSPGQRTDWVSAGEGIRWKQDSYVDGWTRSHTDEIAYRPGSVQKDRWFEPITRHAC